MNEIILRGFFRDIEFSHYQGQVEYEKANLICPRTGGKEEDIISLRYKKYSNKYKEGDFIELKGNLRSYSIKETDKNNVQIYVFTYFDIPEEVSNNILSLDGRICKIDSLRYSKTGIPYVHFILANNIFTNDGKKINSYIPCICYSDNADKIISLGISAKIEITGEFHSHTYKKELDNGEVEFRVAHEVTVKTITEV
ncbi:MAG: single-stranded DNA-binding protein [Romboutsia sp.]|nr:single-stranded DNA-binding protein [Romboutsia sp.]